MALALLLGASLWIWGIPQETEALQYNGTASYMSGKYYQALLQVSRTGDGRTDLINIAKSQVGYQEGGSPNQLSGQVYGGLNHTEYGAWYGIQDMWCAMFVSWCAEVAKVSEEIIPRHAFTPDGLQWFASRGQAYSREEVQAGNYTPQPGDLVYFKSSRNTRTTNHVGIVLGYGDDRLYTIEGNVGAASTPTNGGAVVEKSYPISNSFIVYVCAPDYEVAGTNVPATEQSEEKLRLRHTLTSLETGGELGYDTVGMTQGLSLGIGQWSGREAIALLQEIQAKDQAGFARMDTAGISRWLEQDRLPYEVEAETVTCLKAILASNAGVQAQEGRLDRFIQGAMDQARLLGVTDQEAQLLCTVIAHLGGMGTVRRCVEQTQEDLSNTAILAALEQIHPELYASCRRLIIMEGNYV